MEEAILSRLQKIEDEEAIRIIYACESGSRAWGFPSADSDYDVRFVYIHPKDWYLSIDLEYKRDVIERPIEGQLDLSGWDLRKALKLLRKCNPPLMEWLGSPIVYLEKHSTAAEMRRLVSRYYSPVACLHHYLHMAQGNFREFLIGPTVLRKKYFYVLRPLLAIKWIERGLGIVPTEFRNLADAILESPRLREEVAGLLDAKRKGEELDRGPRIAPISDFIETELARLERRRFEEEYHGQAGPVEEYDRLFRAALEEAWR